MGPKKAELLQRYQYKGLESLLCHNIVVFALVKAHALALLKLVFLGFHYHHSFAFEGGNDLVSHRMMFPGAGVGIKRSDYNLGLVVGKDFLFIYLSVLKRHKSVDIENPLIAVKYVHGCPFCVSLYYHLFNNISGLCISLNT